MVKQIVFLVMVAMAMGACSTEQNVCLLYTSDAADE